MRRFLILPLSLALLACPDPDPEAGSLAKADATGADGAFNTADLSPVHDLGSGGADSGGTDPGPTPTGCIPGVPCNDGDPCTTGDVCVDGACVGTPSPCDDGLECTRDVCDGDGGCASEVIAGSWCLIQGVCFRDGQANPGNLCEACVAPVVSYLWTPSDGGECDDGLDCTGEDRCAGGQCQGTKNPCDDGNDCTTNGCKEGEGCIHAALQGPCEDGDFCTVGDTCLNGKCNPGSLVLTCNDGDPCTTDTCKQGGGCQHAAHNGACDDGDPCTVGDSCAQGECTGGAGTPSCDDQNPCTDDLCIPGHGCAHKPNLAPCEDGDVCTKGDTCSAGKCVTGLGKASCEDGNPCTQGACEPFKGCAFFPKGGPCEDGNPCTEGTTCVGGLCQGGVVTPCDDGNPCTDDVCTAQKGCTHPNNAAPCEDGDSCTEGDTCQGGVCVANPLGCDDQNPCTVDYCDGPVGCVHDPATGLDCRLRLTIQTPSRGATLTGSSTVFVKGTVLHPAGPLAWITVNGTEVPVDSKGGFSGTVTAVHGMNLVIAEAEDALGNADKAVQSFYWSTGFLPMNAADPKKSAAERALYIYLGPEAIDDGNHAVSDADDLATIVELAMGGFDIAGLIPNPVLDNGSFRVSLKNLKYQKPKVQLIAVSGGLELYASIKGLRADVDVKGLCFVCPNLSGDISVQDIIIKTKLLISAPNGKVTVTMQNTDVQLLGADVNVDGILGSIFDFLVDFLVNQFTGDIEQAFKDQLGGIIPSTLASALSSLAFDTSFALGPFFDGGGTVTVSLKTGLETTWWTDDGGTFRLWGAATSPKKVNHPVLGVLQRKACGKAFTEALNLSMTAPLQLGLSDDLLNQILHAAWQGGAMAFPLPPTALGGVDLTQFGISDLSLSVDFLLPPIVGSCNPFNELLLQIGDVEVSASMKLFGSPVSLKVYASVEAYLTLTAGADGIGLQLEDFKRLETDVVVLQAGFDAEALVAPLIGDELLPVLFESLTSLGLDGFPLPEIDLGGLVPGVGPGVSIAIQPNQVTRNLGWTVVSGGIK